MIKKLFTFIKAENTDEEISARGQSLYSSVGFILSHHLWIQILIGMFLGILTGLIISPEGIGLFENDTAQALGAWIAIPGILFLSCP